MHYIKWSDTVNPGAVINQQGMSYVKPDKSGNGYQIIPPVILNLQIESIADQGNS